MEIPPLPGSPPGAKGAMDGRFGTRSAFGPTFIASERSARSRLLLPFCNAALQQWRLCATNISRQVSL
jgi:hypothetical protein